MANDNAYQALFNAAQVISLDHKIGTWLSENDPQALVQLHRAIRVVQAEIDTRVAIEAMAEKFDRITDMTFLSMEQEAAVLTLLEKAIGTLMMRGRSRESQKFGADTSRALAAFYADRQTQAKGK